MAIQTLRDRALKFTLFREKTIKISVPTEDGSTEELTLLLKQPTVSQRNSIIAEMRGDGKREIDAGGLGRGQALAVILCCLDPATREPVFTDADLETLLNMPAGGFLDELSTAAMSLLSDAEQAAKT